METKTEQIDENELKNLGFTTAASNLIRLKEKGKKLMLAYEHFRYVRQTKIDKFNKKLYRESKDGVDYKRLSFTSIKDYNEIPPAHVLNNLKDAKEINCFDYFEIAHIIEVKDPILFGRINDCSDRFFIDQWDEDVRIEDILMPNEG